MNSLIVAGIGAPSAAAITGFVAYRLGMRRSAVDEREATVEERRVTIEERQFDAALRDELRSSNTLLTQQVAHLTGDNGRVHKNLHDVRNEMIVMQESMLGLADEHRQCRRDLAEVLLAVNALEHGRERMAERLDKIEEDADG